MNSTDFLFIDTFLLCTRYGRITCSSISVIMTVSVIVGVSLKFLFFSRPFITRSSSSVSFSFYSSIGASHRLLSLIFGGLFSFSDTVLLFFAFFEIKSTHRLWSLLPLSK